MKTRFPWTAAARLAGFLGLAAALHADRLETRWQLAPSSRPYVDAGNALRGLAYDPVKKYVVITPRAGTPRVLLLAATDGADGSGDPGAAGPRTLGFLDAEGNTLVSGGTFPINLVGVAGDGAVYVANLTTSATSPFKVYRWAEASPEAVPAVAYADTPQSQLGLPVSTVANDYRFGDTFAVRGSGTNTVLAAMSRTGRFLLLFSTTNGTQFTPKAYATDIPSGGAGLGLAFGAGNTFWTKASGQSLRRLELVESNATARTLNTFPGTVIPAGGSALATDASARRLAMVDTSGSRLLVYDISNPAGPVELENRLNFPLAEGATAPNANGNGTGAAAFSEDSVFALNTNNGLLAARVVESVIPPAIITQPAGGNPYLGTSFTLGVGAQGSSPLAYQWSFDGTPIPGATQPTLTLTHLAADQAGPYQVTITNAAGSVTSANAVVSVRIPLSTPVLSPAWRLLPGDRPTLNTDNTQRGLAYNPASSNLLYISRTTGNQVVVLDAATGAQKHLLRTTDVDEVNVIAGGTIPLNMLGVTPDGVVYAANLNTDAAAGLRVYRWENDGPDTIPSVVEVPGLTAGQRYGDTLAVRGTGAASQLLFASRSGREFTEVTVSNGGATVAVQARVVPGLADGGLGLGLAYGDDTTLWATSSGQPVVRVGWAAGPGDATLLGSYPGAQIPTAITHLAYDPVNKLLAGTALETPDNVQLFDVANPEEPRLLDQELFPLDNANVNGTGALALGGGRLFALSSNNGIHAFRIDLNPAVPGGPATLGTPAVADGQVTFTLTGTAGAVYEVQTSAGLGGFQTSSTVTLPAGGSLGVALPATGDVLWIRAVAK